MARSYFTGVMSRSVWPVALFLLAAYFAITVSASTHKGPSFDEGEELTVGYNIWLHSDFRMEAANGDLVKRWATLPYLLSKPNFVSTDALHWREADPYPLAYEFFFNSRNNPENLLFQGRVMNALLGVATGLIVFLCSRQIFGDGGGLISLSVFALSPHMLAFGGMVSTEMSVCLTLLLSTWCIWRLLHRLTSGWLILSLASSVLLFLAKPSALVILPITAVLIAAKLSSKRAFICEIIFKRVIVAKKIQFGIFLCLIGLHAVIAWASIWACYDFRYSASPDAANSSIHFRQQSYRDPVGPVASAALSLARKTHLFPEGYIMGMDWLLGQDDQREAFMDGEWKVGGRRIFFFRALWVKTAPELLLLFGLGSLFWLWMQRAALLRGLTVPPLYEAIPWIVLIAVYVAVAAAQNINIGHRHILPIYPAIYVLAGSSILLLHQMRGWSKVLVPALLLWLGLDALRMFPHYLAYFSPVVGGPGSGYQHLVDSSVDWGMDLPGVKRWLLENNPGEKSQVYLAYFGTDSVDRYGINARRLPSFFDWRSHAAYPLEGGIYMMSATLYESVYTRTFGPWNKNFEEAFQNAIKNMAAYDATANDPSRRAALIQSRSAAFWDQEYDSFENLRFGRLCAWLRHKRQPDAMVGYSILIWRLDTATVREALFGPPMELWDAPVGIN